MAARNFTGSARIRTAGNKSDTIKSSAELADTAPRMEDIRDGVNLSIESSRDLSVREGAGIAAALKRRTCDRLIHLVECLERLIVLPDGLCHGRSARTPSIGVAPSSIDYRTRWACRVGLSNWLCG